MDALRLISSGDRSGQSYEEIERLLSCPICLEVYSKPVVILPCQHNLCRKCANDIFQSRGTPMGSGGRFRCPTCRYEVVLDRHGVYGLQRNLLVENIIDMYQSESRKPNFKKPDTVMCTEHEEEKVNIYCITCQKPTCSLCKVFGQHQTCQVSPMEKIYKDHKEEISTSIALLVGGNDRLQAIISQTEELGKLTEANGRQVKSDLCSAFDRLYAMLEDRKNTMMNKITADMEERNQVIKDMLTAYGKQLEGASKLMEGALALLEERSIPQFLTLSREIITKVTDASKESEVKKPPFNIQNMDEFQVDFSGQESNLAQLDYCASNEDQLTGNQIENDTAASQSTNTDDHLSTIEYETDSSEDLDVTEPHASTSGLTSQLDAFGIASASNDLVDVEQNDEGNRFEDISGFRNEGTKKSRWYDMYVRELPKTFASDDADSKEMSSLLRTSAGRRYKLPVPESDSEEEIDNIMTSSSSECDVIEVRPTRRHRSFANLSIGRSKISSFDSESSSPVTSRSPTNPVTSLDAVTSRDGISRQSGAASRRRPRMYCTHRRRTWSHLLDKKK